MTEKVKVHIVDRTPTQQEWKEMEGNYVLFTSNSLLINPPKGIQLLSLDSRTHQSLKEQAKKETRKYLDSFSREKNGINLRALSYEDFNLWFYHRFRLTFSLQTAFFKKLVIEHCSLDKEVSSVLSNDTILNDLLKLEGFECTKTKNLPSQLSKVSWLTQVITHLFIQILWSIVPLLKSLRPNFFLIVHSNQFRGEKLNNSKLRKNVYFDFLIRDKDIKICQIEMVLFPKPMEKPDYSFLKNHHSIKSGAIVALLGFWHFSSIRNFKNWIDSLSSKDFHPKFSIIMNDILRHKKSFILFFITSLKFSKFFSFYMKTQSIITVDENSPNPKSILLGAKRAGLQTIALQHGTITTDQPAYRHNDIESLFNWVPDLTLTWGESWNKILQASPIYNHRNLKIVGHPNRVQPSLKTNTPKRKTVVFLSQPIPDHELYIQLQKDIFYVLSSLQGVDIIVKLHPRETQLDVFDKLCQQNDFTSFRYAKGNENLYSIFETSDVSITYYSTAAIEALYFNNRLAFIDYLEEDLNDFKKEKVGLMATNGIGLRKNVQLLLEDPSVINDRDISHYIQSRTGSFNLNPKEEVKNILMPYRVNTKLTQPHR